MTVGVPPSASVALALQVSMSSLFAEAGVMLTAPSSGAVLRTVALADPETRPPSVSVAMTEQVSVSPGSSVAATT